MADIFVARQPILGKDKQVYAYELLFRGAADQFGYQALDGERATAQVLENSLLNIGLAKLTNQRPAFVNFPAAVLLNPFVMQLPAELIVIEILETVVPTPEVLARCRDLKTCGFRLALDDFVLSPDYRALVDLADYIKVDFRLTQGAQRRKLVEALGRPGLTFLAEKVETDQEYQAAVADGYQLLQGYFFSKPETIAGKTLTLAEQTAWLLLEELAEDEIDYARLEKLIRRDVALSYKILRFINSPYFGFQMEITSIRQALTMVGQKELYKWACLLVLGKLGAGKSPELMVLALQRARFAELLAEKLPGHRTYEFFLGGMFSLIDAFFNCPMEQAAAVLPVKQPVKDALLGGANTLGLVLRLMEAYERGDWEQGRLFAMSLGLSETALANVYYEAQLWGSRCRLMADDA